MSKRPKPDPVIMAVAHAKHLARDHGRWITFHALDKAEEKAGWELADQCLSTTLSRRKLFNDETKRGD